MCFKAVWQVVFERTSLDRRSTTFAWALISSFCLFAYAYHNRDVLLKCVEEYYTHFRVIAAREIVVLAKILMPLPLPMSVPVLVLMLMLMLMLMHEHEIR